LDDDSIGKVGRTRDLPRPPHLGAGIAADIVFLQHDDEEDPPWAPILDVVLLTHAPAGGTDEVVVEWEIMAIFADVVVDLGHRNYPGVRRKVRA
jgi:hypothetical protein